MFNSDKTVNTSAYMIAGDTIRERNIGVAPKFPHIKMQRGEIATTKDIASVLGVKQGD